MKASVVTSKNVIECMDIEDPRPSHDEVVVRVAYCGICGSDVPRVLFGTAHSYPIVLGHEFSGVVSEIGDDVDRSMLGARVAGIPLVPCMDCPDCVAGNYSLCEHYGFIGSRRPGAFAQYVSVPAANVMRISDATSFEEGALFEPASVALHAIYLSEFEPGKSAIVVGCGTIGILLAQMLVGMGASRVVGLARKDSRLKAARAAGVPEAVDTSKEGWRENLLSTCQAKGFDYVFDTSGNADMMVDTFGLASNKGSICMVGTPKHQMCFTVKQWECLNRRELTVRGSWMSYSAPFPGREWADVARFFNDGTLHLVTDMVDSVYTLDAMSEAFDKFRQGGNVSGKIFCKCNNL